jgi:5-methylcytosine-specific restriction endonuclease McrA
MRSDGSLSWSALSGLVTGGIAKCAHCGSRQDLVAHHKVPRRLGGLDLIENLEPVCRSCHPRVEQEARAEAELTWERPEVPDEPRRARQSPRLPRLY